MGPSWVWGSMQGCNASGHQCSCLHAVYICFSRAPQRWQLDHALMQTSPSGLCSILSMPLGPREDCSIRDIAFAACMLAFWASIPRMRCFFSCSCHPPRICLIS